MYILFYLVYKNMKAYLKKCQKKNMSETNFSIILATYSATIVKFGIVKTLNQFQPLATKCVGWGECRITLDLLLGAKKRNFL